MIKDWLDRNTKPLGNHFQSTYSRRKINQSVASPIGQIDTVETRQKLGENLPAHKHHHQLRQLCWCAVIRCTRTFTLRCCYHATIYPPSVDKWLSVVSHARNYKMLQVERFRWTTELLVGLTIGYYSKFSVMIISSTLTACHDGCITLDEHLRR